MIAYIGRRSLSAVQLRAGAAGLLASIVLLEGNAAAQVSGSLGIHDPSTVLQDGSKFFMFGTGQGIISKESNDHFAWSAGPTVFPPGSPPSWTTAAVPAFSGNFWAPDVAYFNGKYHLYYSVSSFGSQDSAIGLVTNPTLDPDAANYQWTDQGPVIQSNPSQNPPDPYNAIDPAIIQTSSGEIWMSFGSFWNGIYITQIDSATGKRLAPNVAPNSIARHFPLNPNAIEAPYIYERDGYFYLFVNWDRCCQGVNSTYNIRVGRSTSVTGPYFDQNGMNMVNGGGTLFLGTEGQFIGPGHMGILEDQGVEWFGYHYYNANANGAPTYNLRQLYWTPDGWPSAVPFFSPADLNSDTKVDLDDYAILRDHMKMTGASPADGDMNGDTIVNHADFHIWKAIYHGGGGAGAEAAQVPEPSTVLALVTGTVMSLMGGFRCARGSSTRRSDVDRAGGLY
jgi:arabinan endo-1,5-alpha-L-arabinosidase